MESMRAISAFPVIAIFIVILVSIVQGADAEEPDYQNPEIQLKFNLKEDKETLTQQNKMPEEPEAHSTGSADYTQYPFFRSDRQPTKVGTWTSVPSEFDLSINIETADIWWEVKGDDYSPDCEWTFYIHHNDQQVSENTEACQGDGENLEKETYNVGTSIDLVAGDTFALELWYEGWEDVDIYHDNVTYDTGLNVRGSHVILFDGIWKGSEVSIEFSEAWPADWDTNLKAGYIMVMGADGYMADNNKAGTMEGTEYSIQMTNGTVDVTSLIIKWTEVTGNDLKIMMDYTIFDHMGNTSGNGSAKQPTVTLNLQKVQGLLGDDGGILGLPGFEMIIAVPAIAFAARRFKN
jgi:hypothetical protein